MTRSLLVGEVRTFFADSSTDDGASYPKNQSAWPCIKAMPSTKRFLISITMLSQDRLTYIVIAAQYPNGVVANGLLF